MEITISSQLGTQISTLQNLQQRASDLNELSESLKRDAAPKFLGRDMLNVGVDPAELRELAEKTLQRELAAFKTQLNDMGINHDLEIG